MVRSLRFITCLSPNVRPMYEGIAEHVGRTLGIETAIEDGPPFPRLDPHRADVLFLCGFPYVLLAASPDPAVEPLAAPVLHGDRYGGRPIYFSDVIVHRDAAATTFAELRGASWAYNEPYSHSGYHLTRSHLARIGETSGFFGRVVESGMHLASIQMVRDGAVDASAIDSQVLAVALRDDPALADDIRVIDALGPSTIQPILVRRDLPNELRAELRDTLVSMHEDAAGRATLAEGLADRLVAVSDSSYDDIRLMAEDARAAGITELP